MAAHSLTALRIVALTCIALGLSACAARDAVGGLFGQRANERPEPVPISQPNVYKDGVEFPVRQPYPRDAESGQMVQEGTSSVRLRPNAPERYTVVRGDTLWDISGKFLNDPWYWPEIWQANDQIANPHLIYPGDVLRLVWIDGKPRIVMDRGDGRLGPQIRVEPLGQAINTIPYDAIAGFLSRPTVIAKDKIDGLPYIVDIKESHLIAGSGFTVYIRGTDAPVGTRFNVFHIGDEYRDPDTGDKLGHEALYVGTGRVTGTGVDVSSLLLTETVRETLRGDRLLMETTVPTANFLPRPPGVVVDGKILSVVDGVQLIGQYQIVVINRGAADGLEPGQVLSIYRSGKTAVDRWGKRTLWGLGPKERVDLPEQHNGVMMIFKTESVLSFALVMSATSEIRVGDAVRNPT
jgi:hypothetical protein